MKTTILHLDGQVVIALEHAFASAAKGSSEPEKLFLDRPEVIDRNRIYDLAIEESAKVVLSGYLASLSLKWMNQYFGTMTGSELSANWLEAMQKAIEIIS